MQEGDSTTVSAVSRAPQRRRPEARLYVVYPPEHAGPIPLAGGRKVLGRGPELPDPTISRSHFGVGWDPAASCHVGEDLGSKNGTWVGAARLVSAARPLEDGAVVRLGGMLLVYETGALEAAPEVSSDDIPGDSVAAHALRARVAAAARERAAALLAGETGTGKERIAAEIHRLSRRRGPFLAVNCAALSAELVESQLFGHGRGAFTGAHQAQPGLFRSAEGGTLFLDEIGELPPSLQPKLLRALQEREVLPVGDDAPVSVDVRVVAATNADLPARVAGGTFRRDLLARLSLVTIAVPPLRARRVDVLPWLLRLHARWLAERPGRTARRPTLSAEAAEALLLASWPDNLRGLDRLVHQMEDADLVSLLPTPRPEAPPPEPPAPPRRPAPTREELAAALEAHGGSIRAVARELGRDRKQIYRWLKDRGLR